MKKLIIFALATALHAQSTATVTCPAACTVTVTATTVVTPPVPPATYVGPCDIPGVSCVAAYNLARKARNAYAGSFFTETNNTFAKFYDQISVNDLTPSCCGPNWPSGAVQTTVGSTIPPSGVPVPIARILNGEAYTYHYGAASGIPVGNSSITEYMVVENTSEGGQVSGCCGSFNDSENPIHEGSKGQMFGLSLAAGGMCTVGTGTGPWAGVDLEQGNCLYGPPPTAKYLTILAKYNAATGTLTLKSGDATQGILTTLYSGPLPPGYAGLNLQGAVSLGMGGDGSNSPINFIEGAIIAGATTDAADNALQQNIVNFYGIQQ
jgi:hypothetical protein